MATILSVDDSRVMRDMIKSVLESKGHQVLTANDGLEAMTVARQNKVDLVLADINMPNMNGISLLSKLRNLDGYQYVPIVMVTTEEAEYKKAKAKNMGATGWLQKPFTPERLLAAVKKLLG
ncbi:MAG: response regulator [Gammaproteobacteria bacterium]|nr:response regulator [Gammaproteobacteria bacterium]